MIYSAVEEHVLQAQYNSRQERNISFVNSPLWCGRKDVLCFYINVHFGKKMRQSRQLWVVANPSPAPALTALNICNAVKLEKLIACIYQTLLFKVTYSAFRLYICIVSMFVPWESNPRPLRCLRNALPTEPQEHIYLLILTALIILYWIINKIIYKITLFFF